MGLLKRIFLGECKFAGECVLYNPKSVTCTKKGGDYYNHGEPAGCYKNLVEVHERCRGAEKWKKSSRKSC